MVAEGLFRRAIELTDNDKSFYRAFALKMYAHVLSYKPKRGTEVEKMRSEAKEIEQDLPKSASRMPNLLAISIN